MVHIQETRHPFWEALRQFAPDISDAALCLDDVRRALRDRISALVDAPLDDDNATRLFDHLARLYEASFQVRL